MKKNLIYLGAVVLVGALASCQKEDLGSVQLQKGQTMEFDPSGVPAVYQEINYDMADASAVSAELGEVVKSIKVDSLLSEAQKVLVGIINSIYNYQFKDKDSFGIDNKVITIGDLDNIIIEGFLGDQKFSWDYFVTLSNLKDSYIKTDGEGTYATVIKIKDGSNVVFNVTKEKTFRSHSDRGYHDVDDYTLFTMAVVDKSGEITFSIQFYIVNENLTWVRDNNYSYLDMKVLDDSFSNYLKMSDEMGIWIDSDKILTAKSPLSIFMDSENNNGTLTSRFRMISPSSPEPNSSVTETSFKLQKNADENKAMVTVSNEKYAGMEAFFSENGYPVWALEGKTENASSAYHLMANAAVAAITGSNKAVIDFVSGQWNDAIDATFSIWGKGYTEHPADYYDYAVSSNEEFLSTWAEIGVTMENKGKGFELVEKEGLFKYEAEIVLGAENVDAARNSLIYKPSLALEFTPEDGCVKEGVEAETRVVSVESFLKYENSDFEELFQNIGSEKGTTWAWPFSKKGEVFPWTF